MEEIEQILIDFGIHLTGYGIILPIDILEATANDFIDVHGLDINPNTNK